MQTVLTDSQVKKITNGRTPHLPVEYEQACKALAACVNLDEGKYWSDKADVLAAWAKMYRDDTIARQAKILKLRAFRRMGEIARELAKGRRLPASQSLRDAGLKKSEVDAAKALSLATEKQIETLENRQTVPTIHSARGVLQGRGESEPQRYAMRALNDLAFWSKKVTPGEFRKYVSLRPHKQSKWKENCEEVQEWISLLLGTAHR